METRLKRLLSFAMAIFMVIGMMPANVVYAEGTDGEVEPHEHSYEAVVTAPTCTAAGFTTFTCGCGDSYTADEVPAIDHTYGENDRCACGALDPTHEHTYAEGKCVCGAEEPKHEHTYGENDKCECGVLNPAHVHTYAEGKCVCGAEEPKHEHSYGENDKCECGVLNPAHVHTYAEGKCVCGAEEPKHEHSYGENDKCECGVLNPAHVHTYAEGKCICGAEDVNAVAENGDQTPPAAPYIDYSGNSLATNVDENDDTVIFECVDDGDSFHFWFDGDSATVGEVIWDETLQTWTCEVTLNVQAFADVMQSENSPMAGHEIVGELPATYKVTYKWQEDKWHFDGDPLKISCKCPEVDGVIDTEDELVAAIAEGGTVTLGGSITLTKSIKIPAGTTVTLDLAGYTISQNVACDDSYALIANNGRLTITGNGKISLNDSGANSGTAWGAYTIRNEGTLVVQNGTIENVAPSSTSYVNNAIFNYSGTTTINGGTFYVPYSRSVRLWHGAVTINGGSFDGQVWVQPMSACSLTINGGSFKPGTSSNDGSSVYITNDTYTVALSVTGGSFATKIGAADAAALAGTVTGGTFSEAAQTGTKEVLLGEGLEFNENGELVEAAKKQVTVVVPEADEIKTEKPADVKSDEMNAAVNAVISAVQSNTAIEKVQNLPENATLVIKPIGVSVEEDDTVVITKITYEVTPVVDGEEVSNPGASITFRLPVPASVTQQWAKVWHGTESLGIYPVQGSGDGKYVEITSSSFSPYSLEFAEGNYIDLSAGSFTIGEEGSYIVLPYTGSNTLTIKANANVELQGVNITAGADASAISIESGNVTLNVTADSAVTGGDNGAGIYVAEGAALTVTGTAKLTATGNAGADDASGAAGIGGTWAKGNSGAITIDGATVVASGYGVHGSGIGSGSGKVVGAITIKNGANVTAYGGYYANGAGTKLQSSYGKSDPEGGAAIGGGGKTASTIANITITDSTVKAYGGSKAAGIGANFWCSAGTITISGSSNVTAQGGSSSAGIGTSRAGDTGVSANIVITGGTVNATGGAYGAGIGAGYNADSLGNGANTSALPETSISISGGTVIATGGEGGAGIGGGYKSNNNDIDITGGNITAVAGPLVSGKTVENGGSPAAIGSGSNGSGTFAEGPKTDIGANATVKVTAYEDGKPAIEGMTNEAAEEGSNTTLTLIENPNKVYEAQIGDKKYETLEEAIAVGGEIKLLVDVTRSETIKIEKDLILDLGGKTLNGSILAPNSDLTVKNGKIVNANAGVSALEINAGKLTLTDVDIDSARHALRIDGAVTATVNGGTCRSGIGSGTGTYHALNVSGTANVTIKDGTFTGPKGTSADSGYAVMVQSGSTVTIEGGSFGNGAPGTLKANTGATLTVTGGKFDEDPKAYVAEGYVSGKGTDGIYIVGKLPEAEVTNLTANGPVMIKAGEYSIFKSGLSEGTEDLILPVALQFTAKDTAEEAAANAFGQWNTDFYITLTGVTGTVDMSGCYLVGNYGSFGTIAIPMDGFTAEGNKLYPVLGTVQENWFTYEAICTSVKDFKCGIYLTEKVLEDHPNLTVNLELRLAPETLPAGYTGNDYLKIGQTYTYGAEELKVAIHTIDLSSYDVFKDIAVVYVDGKAYPVEDNLTVKVYGEQVKKASMFLTTYTYEGKTEGDYPTGMQVWLVKGTDMDVDGIFDTFATERVSKLDDFFIYEGTSIRVGGTSNGIRFITSVNASDSEKLMKGTFAFDSGSALTGAKMVTAGTEFWKTDKVARSEVYGGAAGSTFRVFQKSGKRNQFTGVLVGLDTKAQTIVASIYSRPYAEIKLKDGSVATLYGGTLDRSIYYVATQNKDTFTAGTANDKFIEGLITKGKTLLDSIKED